MNVSDFIVGRLAQWRVGRIYGYPGDGINGLFGALHRDGCAIDFIQVRHEEMAAFMACAHAKFTGDPGVCIATSGPGAIHLLNGLYDAKADHVPVVAIVGQAATTALGSSYQQEVDLQQLFEDACEYVYTIASPAAAAHVVDRAFRTAIGMRAVTAIVIPKDIQEANHADPPRKHNTAHSSVGLCKPVVMPNEDDLRRAAAILNSSDRIAMLVGAGALGATNEVIAVADRLNAGIAKALLGKAAVPDDLPFVTGTIGLLGTKPSSDMMEHCDALLMVGTSFPYSEFLPPPGKVPGIQIDIDPRNLGIRYPTELNLVGDTAATLRALLPLLDAHSDGSWRKKLEDAKNAWEEQELARAHVSASPLNPQLLFTELSKRVPDNAILTGDAGTATNWFARNVKVRRGMKASLSGGLATMGGAVPYAIAAKFAFPDRVAIAMTGDGAMQMNGMAELLTVAKYWQTWSDPRLIVLVLNNADLNQVTWEMRVMNGDPKFDASQNLPDFSYAAFAEQAGLLGIPLDDPANVEAAWASALNAERPVVIDAKVDPAVPQLPPHITFDEAHHYFSAMTKSDPQLASVIKESIKTLAAGAIPQNLR